MGIEEIVSNIIAIAPEILTNQEAQSTTFFQADNVDNSTGTWADSEIVKEIQNCINGSYGPYGAEACLTLSCGSLAMLPGLEAGSAGAYQHADALENNALDQHSLRCHVANWTTGPGGGLMDTTAIIGGKTLFQYIEEQTNSNGDWYEKLEYMPTMDGASDGFRFRAKAIMIRSAELSS